MLLKKTKLNNAKNKMKSIKETVNFLEPIIIPINDVELEVFEEEKKI